jgi:GDPmannose 4,6-dehydratase
MKKKILITGILGQDGANMAELLLEQDQSFDIYGMMRRSSVPNFKNIKKIKNHPFFSLVYGDLTDEVSINQLVKDIQPDYFINFGANSFVGCSWDMPMQVFDVNAMGVLRCLESIRKFKPDCRFYSAGSSEEFGDVDFSPQTLQHPMKPRSPYGASKCAAHHIVKVYRESYDLYAVHGILFNHEGTKRGEEFVTRKISKGVARIRHEFLNIGSWRSRSLDDQPPIITPIELGFLDSKRDWSDSKDFMAGIWLMLNQNEPEEYLLASGETHSIREFVEKAFEVANLSGKWEGSEENEQFVHDYKGQKMPLVKINPKYYRPAEVNLLLGDPSEAREKLGWKQQISFDKLVEKMVLWDLNEIQKEA